VRRRGSKLVDLSTVMIGGGAKKPAKPFYVRVPTKQKYRGQCPACGGRRVIDSAVPGITILCPLCTGYQKCGL
jgi:hypothetical protein